MIEKKIHDSDLGDIKVRISTRAVHIRLQVSKGTVIATLPSGVSINRLLDFIQLNKEKLRASLAKYPVQPLITEATVLETASFKLHVFCTDRENFYMRLEQKVLNIACPAETDFTDSRVQTLLKEWIEKALRHEAVRLLPKRLQELASLNHFTFSSVKINKSGTHWGSCTARKSINLSLSLMILPWHLIDYVLLHELCHTVEMNHGPRFWKLLDSVTHGQAQDLRREMKQYHTF